MNRFGHCFVMTRPAAGHRNQHRQFLNANLAPTIDIGKPCRQNAGTKKPGTMTGFFLATERWCPGADSNHRHADFQSTALPTELPGQIRLSSPFPECSLRNEAGYTNSFRACPASISIFFRFKIPVHLQGLQDTPAVLSRGLHSFRSATSQGRGPHSVLNRMGGIFPMRAARRSGSRSLLFSLNFSVPSYFFSNR